MSRKPLFAVLLSLSVALLSFAAEAPKEASLGALAPAFSAQDATGKTIKLDDYKGKIVVLEWINKDCPIDQRVINSKLISNVHEKFKDKVVWLAVDSTHNHAKADYDATIKQWNLSYPLLNDASGAIGHAYGAQTTPHLFIVNTDGKLVFKGGIDNDPVGDKPTKLNYVDQALTELTAGKSITISESKPYGCTVKYAQ
jgi:peroxiredoxin